MKIMEIHPRALGLIILLLALTMACVVPGIPTFIAPSPTSITGVMVTSTTVPATATLTPRPTVTATPPPEWVTIFAQPILDAIADVPPDFQDDFDDKSGGWHFEEWCGDWRMNYINGEMVINVGIHPGTTVGQTWCRIHRNDIDYDDFVVEVDGRFLPESAKDSRWRIDFRSSDIQATGHSYGVIKNGGLSIEIYNSPGAGGSFPSENPAGQFNRLLLIAQGSKFAFYANGKPLDFVESIYFPYGDIFLKVGNRADAPVDAIAAFDNFKIWDISDLLTQP